MSQKPGAPTTAAATVAPLDKLKAERVEIFLKKMPEWRLVQQNTAITRRIVFATAIDALAFAGRVARLAERHGGRPQIRVEGSRLLLTLTTPHAGGLTAADFALADWIRRQVVL